MINLLISRDLFSVLYPLVFYSFAVICLVFSISIDNKDRLVKYSGKYCTLFCIVLLIVLIGFRAYNVGTDTANYHLFNWVNDYPPESQTEIMFHLLLSGTKMIDGASFTLFLLLISSLFYFFIYKTFLNISNYYRVEVVFLLLSFLALFFSSTLTINVMRQGLSLAILLYAYSLWLKDRNLIKIFPFILMSLLTHTTSIIPVLLFLSVKFFLKKISLSNFYILYFMGILLAAINLGILNILPFIGDFFQDSRTTNYLSSEDKIYVVGFKLQFVIFNTVFLAIFSYCNEQLKKYNLIIYSDYEELLKYYIIASFIFFMVFQIPYSDRWGLFSWIFIPILSAPLFSRYINLKFLTPLVMFFVFIFIFFSMYG